MVKGVTKGVSAHHSSRADNDKPRRFPAKSIHYYCSS
jgi:hypothetical protein